MVIDLGARRLSGAATVPPPDAPDGIAPELPKEAQPADLDTVQSSWVSSLEDLLARWFEFQEPQEKMILDVLERDVASNDVIALLNISASRSEAAAVLEQAMLDLGAEAAAQVVRDASAQGLPANSIDPVHPDRLRTAQSAEVYVGQLVASLVGSAIGEAMRVWSLGRSARDVRDDVEEHLSSLTNAYPRLVLGGALSQAQMAGRLETIVGGPEAAIYADERLDVNTCKPCRDINRKWLGNSSDREMIQRTYPVSGYVGCLGRWRCRGQTVAVWRGGDDWRKWVELPAQRT